MRPLLKKNRLWCFEYYQSIKWRIRTMKTNTSKKLWSLFAVAVIALAGIAFALPAEKDFITDRKLSEMQKKQDFPLQLFNDKKEVDKKEVDYKRFDFKLKDNAVVDIASDLRLKDARSIITGQATAVQTLPIEAVPKPLVALAESNNIPLETLETLYENRAYVWSVDGAGLKRDAVPLMFGGASSLQTMVMGHQYRGKKFNYWNGDVYIKGKLSGDVHGIYKPINKKSGAFLGYFKDTASGATQLGLGLYVTQANGQRVWYLYNPESQVPATTVLWGNTYIGFRVM